MRWGGRPSRICRRAYPPADQPFNEKSLGPRGMYRLTVTTPELRYYRSMASSRDRLHEIVDALPERQLEAALQFLSEMGDEEVIDCQTAAKLDAARAESGNDVPLEDLRRRLKL